MILTGTPPASPGGRPDLIALAYASSTACAVPQGTWPRETSTRTGTSAAVRALPQNARWLPGEADREEWGPACVVPQAAASAATGSTSMTVTGRINHDPRGTPLRLPSCADNTMPPPAPPAAA